jgi:UrcA family protein
MKTSILTFALGASVLALVAAPAASVSAQPEQSPSVTVKYSDLNISNREGARTVYRRIESTARNLCGDEPDIHDVGALHSWRACVNTSVDNAVGRLDAPMVTALNGGRSGSIVKVAQAH